MTPREILAGPGRSREAVLAWPLAAAGARAAACLVAAALGLFMTVLVFFPGHMNVDAILQLQEARNGVYFDWHPPLMAAIWSILDRIVAGPLGMLVLQNILFWAALGLIGYQARLSPAVSAVGILMVGLFPPLFGALGTIWKDTAMAAALLLAYALLLCAHTRPSRLALGAAAICLFYALALRHNASVAVLPLALWAGALAQRTLLPPARPHTGLAVAMGVTLIAVLGLSAQLTERLLVREENRLYPAQQILIHDLLAVSVQSQVVYLPDFLAVDREPLSISTLECLYDPTSAVAVWNARYGACDAQLRKITVAAEESELTRIWLAVIPRHLDIYVEHRLNAFSAQIGIGLERVCYPLQAGTEPNTLGIETQGSAVNAVVMKLMAGFAYLTPLFRTWIYLALLGGLLALVALRRHADPLPSLVLGSSGLLYGLAYVFVSTSCDFRLGWWSVVAAVMLLATLLANAQRGWT